MKIVFSCSNDKSVMFWKLNDNSFYEYTNSNAAYVISKYNQDYVKVYSIRNSV